MTITATSAKILVALDPLLRDNYIDAVRSDDGCLDVRVSVRVRYRKLTDGSKGYDDDSAAKAIKINGILNRCGLRYRAAKTAGLGREVWLYTIA